MIGSFKDRRLKRLYERGDRSRLQANLVYRIEAILGHLDVALTIDDMDIQGFRLHPLKGNYKGFWSVTVRDNWRIIFRFENGYAHEIEMVDYH
jgi:proteic killer suppression protein